MINMLSNSQLVRAINTTKDYIQLDMRYSCNHSAGKVTFTNSPTFNNDMVLVMDTHDQTGLHGVLSTLVQSINKGWMRDCYHYSDFNTYCKDLYSITEGQYQTALKWCDL